MITIGEEISSAKEATDILGYISRWKFEYWIEATDGWMLGAWEEVQGTGRDGLSLLFGWESGQVTC